MTSASKLGPLLEMILAMALDDVGAEVGAFVSNDVGIVVGPLKEMMFAKAGAESGASVR